MLLISVVFSPPPFFLLFVVFIDFMDMDEPESPERRRRHVRQRNVVLTREDDPALHVATSYVLGVSRVEEEPDVGSLDVGGLLWPEVQNLCTRDDVLAHYNGADIDTQLQNRGKGLLVSSITHEELRNVVRHHWARLHGGRRCSRVGLYFAQQCYAEVILGLHVDFRSMPTHGHGQRHIIRDLPTPTIQVIEEPPDATGASSSSSHPHPTLNPYSGFFLSSENMAQLANIVGDIINNANNQIEQLERTC